MPKTSRKDMQALMSEKVLKKSKMMGSYKPVMSNQKRGTGRRGS